MLLKIDKRKMNMLLFMMLLLFSGIPYLFYGLVATQANFLVLGGLTYSIDKLTVPWYARAFVYVKDGIAVVLVMLLVFKMRKDDFLMFFLISAYGICGLLITGRFDILYVVAGLRFFIFTVAVYLFFRRYTLSLEEVKKIVRIVELITVIQLLITFVQIVKNGNLAEFGSSVYRYSGAFIGSGNLGCFCLAAILMMYFAFSRCKIIGRKELLVFSFFYLFLSIASGTRTAMGGVFAIALYAFLDSATETRHGGLSKKTVVAFFLLIFIVIVPIAYSWMIQRVARGDAEVSGMGRVEILYKILSGTDVELLIGRGIGYGTNASIVLGVTDTFVSDSTINLILVQFGVLGLVLFLIYFARRFSRMLVLNCSKPTTIMLIGIFVVLCMVGNLFEQISMSEIYLSVFFLNMQWCGVGKPSSGGQECLDM